MGTATYSTSDARKSFLFGGSGRLLFYGCKVTKNILILQIFNKKNRGLSQAL